MAKGYGPRKLPGGKVDAKKLDQIVARGRREAATRMSGYREQSLRLHPRVCARCGREFTQANLHELTVHHKDHNHDNNPPDGSNWENLCMYCHDWEHQKYSHLVRGELANFGLTQEKPKAATFQPFANLKDMLGEKKNK